MKSARNVARATLLALLAFVALQASPALGAAPELKIAAPASEAWVDSSLPSFSGTTSYSAEVVAIEIYAGQQVSGSPVQTIFSGAPVAGSWEAAVEDPLADGQYTAVAEQAGEPGEPAGESQPVTFRIDTTKPDVTIDSVAPYTNNPTPALAGDAGVALGDLPGIAVKIYAGTVATGTPVAEQTVQASHGKWSDTAPQLADGTYTAQASQEDEAGNLGRSASVGFTVDTVAPSVSIDSLPAYTKDTTPTFAGEAGDEPGDQSYVTVQLFSGTGVGGSLLSEVNAPIEGGDWTLDSATLANGTYTVRALHRDAAGNTGTSKAVTFTVDTVAPAVTVTKPPEYTNEPTLVLKGAAGTAAGDIQSVLVKLYKGTTATGTPVLSEHVTPSSGKWSLTHAALENGAYTVQASQEDEAGNVGLSAADTFTVDTVKPVVTITSAPPKYTTETTPTAKGTLGNQPGDIATVSVTVYEGTAVGGTVAVAATDATVTGTTWSYTVPHALLAGTYTVQASQSDKAGNTGTSAGATFTVDLTAPSVSVEAMPEYTKETKPTISGTSGTAPGDVQSVLLKLSKGVTTVLEETVVPTGGAWSLTPATALEEGTYTVQATQHDEAGNVGTSAPVSFTVDDKAPAVAITTPGSHQAPFHVSQPTFAGTGGEELGDQPTIKLFIYEVTEQGQEVLQDEVAGVSIVKGSWSTHSSGPHLSDGVYTIVAERSDAAGNTTRTAPVEFRVETTSPAVSIETSGLVTRTGSEGFFTNAQPSFSGQAQGDEEVLLSIYEGSSTTGRLVTAVPATRSGIAWSAGPLPALPDGTYTAQAQQSAAGEATGFSNTVPFTVDADPPVLSIATPSAGGTALSTSVTAGGAAGTAPGDLAPVTVQLYPGTSSEGQAPIETVTVQSAGGSWLAPLGSLTPGTYTLRAEQSDDVGNLGRSAPVTFTAQAPAAPPPPTASFTWYPTAPHVGEPVSLVSTSTDPTSAIVAYAWSLTGLGAPVPGSQTIDTTFTTPGSHAVKLAVTDAIGASATTTETIPVTAQPVNLMQPFPVVRIAGTEYASGVTIKLLTVQAPVGAKVTITCKGKGCPTRSVTTFASASASKTKKTPGTVLLGFRRFERRLPAGLTLEIKVSKAGEIGKYTRFTTRHGKLPTRVDECLGPAGNAMECPST